MLAVALVTAASASATTTYATTYVAGSGGVDAGAASDGNSCNSESTPCQTLAGALAETSSGGTVELSGTLSESAATVVDQNVAIEANAGGVSAQIKGSSDTDGLLTIGDFTVTISGVTFVDGQNNSTSGGAITNDSGGTLTVNESTFTSNTSGSGGAIANGATTSGAPGASGTLIVTDSTFTDNSASDTYGAAIANGTYASGTATITGSTFTGNTMSSDGGGTIDNGSYGSGTLTVSDSTFANNLTSGVGGAIGSWDGTNVLTTVSDSTFVGNTASYGGALFSSGGNNTMVVTDSTFDGNSANNSGGAIENALDVESKLTLVGSTLTGNSSPLGAAIDAGSAGGNGANYIAGDLINGTCNTGAGVSWSDSGYNAATDDSCLGGSTTTGDVVSAATGNLGTLANNGGPTQTVALLAGNPAIDLVPHATALTIPAGGSTVSFACPVTADQRGDANPGTAGCDAGALQYAPQTISFGSVPSSAVVGQSADMLQGTSSSPLALSYSVDAGTTHSACSLSGAAVSFAHAGSCVLDANQAGDDNFAPAPQAQHTITVAPASTSTALTIGSSTLSATVSATAPGGGTPSGTVSFQTGGDTIGSATLVGGVATLTYSVPANTTQRITASYAGSADYLSSNGSTSGSGPTVQPPPTTTATTTTPVPETPTTTTPTPETPTTTTPTPSVPVVKKRVVDPTIRAHLHSTTPKSSSGWWRSPVTVGFSCKTHGSPLVGGCPKAVRLSHSGKHLGLTRTVEAQNGGRAKVTVAGINIDLSRPSVTISGPKPRVDYELTSPAAHCRASDAVSGLRSCRLGRRVAQTDSGELITYRATATSRAGATSSISETISVSSVALLGAAHVGGAYHITPGATYVLEVLADARPGYLAASVAPLAPSGAHDYFVQDGRLDGLPLWRLAVKIETGLGDFSLWNIGVRADGKTHILRLRTS